MSTPGLHLRTAFVLDREGRIVSTREPGPQRGPLFTVVRGVGHCAWAVRGGLPPDLVAGLERLAREEPAAADPCGPPVHASRYLALLRSHLARGGEAAGLCETGGPAFTFPEAVSRPAGVVVVEDESLLQRHFRGWIPGEIAAGRAPVLAVVAEGYPVSVCFCARLSDEAAEAGLETAPAFRGRGLAPRVTAAWASAIRATGRVPLYSTAWTNRASLAVARKLGLLAYASTWSVAERDS
jgi:hypothetical protein